MSGADCAVTAEQAYARATFYYRQVTELRINGKKLAVVRLTAEEYSGEAVKYDQLVRPGIGDRDWLRPERIPAIH